MDAGYFLMWAREDGLLSTGSSGPCAHWQSDVRGDVNQAARYLNSDTVGNPESFLAHLEQALLASQKLVYFVSFWETEYSSL